jgi:two-component system cell cycle sensor histidine kinase/response regulator CckA
MMRRLLLTPREPIARFRALLLGFTLVMAVSNAVVIAVASDIPQPFRVAGSLAALTLAGWWYWGYRRQRFPAFGWLLEGVLLFAVASTSNLPLRALGVFYVAIQFRSLDVSRRQLPWLLAAYSVARVASLVYAPIPNPYPPLSVPVVIQIMVLVIIAIISHLFATATAQHSVIENSLRRSEERYRLLAAVTRDVVYDWDLATNEVEWSESLRTVFGHPQPSGGSGGQWWVDLIHAEDRTSFEQNIRGFLANPSDNMEGIRYRVRRADGSYATVSATMLVQRSADGKSSRVIGSIRDISTEEALQEQLRESRKMEAVGQLAGGVAHDFNNLLTVIGGHVYMLQQDVPASAPLERHLGGITAAAQRAASLTRQLLAFSRKQILKPEVLDLNAVIDDVGRLITPLLGENIRFVTMLAPELEPVLADSGQIGQVLINLALNARDAMPSGGTLIFETAPLHLTRESEESGRTKLPRGEYVRLTARDSGAGMDTATIARAFEPFFTTKPHGKGTGLGLATAYGIVRQSAGDIWVDSMPDRGSTFTILLPVTAAGAVPKRAEQPRAKVVPPAAGDGARVLLVEDDEGVRAFTQQMLTDSGFHVLAARDGLDGLAVAQRNDYAIDFVVTDVIMPEMGGPVMIEHLRRRTPDLRVLYMSGYTDDTDISSDLRASAEALIEKPFTSASFLAAVERVRTRDHVTVKA